MAVIKFFEKTGCVNNTKQKRILELAGHTVEAISIIDYKWNKVELREFFNGVAFKKWFNMNAPSMASGEDNPANYNEITAIDAMLKNPILIKRPLIEVFDIKIVGFNSEELDELIGLKNEGREMKSLLKEMLEVCPQKKSNACNYSSGSHVLDKTDIKGN